MSSRRNIKKIPLTVLTPLLGTLAAAVALPILSAQGSGFSIFAASNGKPKRHARAGQDFRDGEIIIKYKSESASYQNTHATTLGRLGAAKLRNVGNHIEFVHAKLPAGKSVDSAISDLLGDPDVEYAQPNFIYHTTATYTSTTATPGDTDFGQLWGLKNTGQTVTALSAANPSDGTHNPGSSGHDMDLTHAWHYITNCSNIIVAVVDTGIKYDHADLQANMWDPTGLIVPHHGRNVITSASDPTDPMDDAGHGTHVAGTIGAVGDNGIGTTGICWAVQLMAIKALDETGSGSTSDIATGITWAASHGAKVINLSIGGSQLDPAMGTAIDTARSFGALVVVAAGNEGVDNDNTPTYPCNISKANLLCVAALDQAYSLASFSNYGSGSVDVGAPGVNIASTWPFSVTPVTDDFSSGWTYMPNSGGWGLIGGATPYLANPSNWNGSSATYANNANDHVYKTFNLTGLASVSLAYQVQYNMQTNDTFTICASGTGGEPCANGDTIETYTGTTGQHAFYYFDQPVPNTCLTSTCTIGVHFTSDSSSSSTGVLFSRFQINKSVYGTTNYNVLEGTSMATPHVTGLAALIFAFNPNYTYADVIAAIKGGGTPVPALSGKTKTGKGVNAMGSLSFIQAPTSVAAVKL